MNILLDALPEFIVLDNIKYPIRTDFRVWLKFDEIIALRTMKSTQKLIEIIKLCIPCDICPVLPPDVDALMSALMEFFACGESSSAASGTKRIFSFCQDAGYIYSAFLQQYGIDLVDTPHLHWWKFCTLLSGLCDDCRLMQIISLRSTDLNSIKDSKKRKNVKDLQNKYEIKSNKSSDELDRDLAQELSELF